MLIPCASCSTLIQWSRAHCSQCRPRRQKKEPDYTVRYHQLKRATPKWCDHAEVNRFYVECAKRNYNSDIRYVVDHIVPLNHPDVCGLHNEFNLQILTVRENAQKGNTFVVQYF